MHSKLVEGGPEGTVEHGVSLEMPQQEFMYGIWVSEVGVQQDAFLHLEWHLCAPPTHTGG
jgi:hypothetical protein